MKMQTENQRKLIGVWIGLTLSNYIYQLLPGHQDWHLAGERSWFQFLALAAAWFTCLRNPAPQEKA
jgi:hypothetical protein